MRVITEIELRDLYKKNQFTSFELPEGARLTPAAAQFLSERRIPVVPKEKEEEKPSSKPSFQPSLQKQEQPKVQTVELPQVELAGKKPEHMTHLRGKNLVVKNHPRIKFRGKLDSYEALLIWAIIEVEGQGYYGLGRDLRDILEQVRQILAAEVKEEPLSPLSLRGWSEQEIHEFSHHPQKHFGIGHLLPNPGQGKLMALLNILRTKVRELELVAMDAFYEDGQVEREDIIQVLNRLSSLIYVLMLQLAAGSYKIGS